MRLLWNSRNGRSALLFCALAPLTGQTALPPAGHAIQSLPGAGTWSGHLRYELMQFWTAPDAQGSPTGAFLSTLCNNGTAVNYADACPEVRQHSWLMTPTRSIVAQSRQVYAYGVAFHVSGDPWFLDLMKAGVSFIRANAVDRTGGGMFTSQNLKTGVWGPRMELRNPQELAYSLLGLSFYYYLTRDPDVLPDILSVRDHILGRYYNGDLNALQWTLESTSSQPALDKRLTAQLDQLNAYMILMTPILPEPYQSEWKQNLRWLCDVMREQFYNERENLMFLRANSPDDLDIAKSGTDFGHTIKALWMMRFAGLILQDREMVRFAQENGPRVLARAYQAEPGAWAQGVKAGGELDIDKSWWIYCELDQFAATMALTDPEQARYLPSTYEYWFSRFVDRPAGEVWSTVNGTTHQPPPNANPKAWPWKNGYHSSEHALVAFITTSQLQGQPVTLHYNFRAMPGRDRIHPYFFRGTVRSMQTAQDRLHGEIQAITFSDVR